MACDELHKLVRIIHDDTGAKPRVLRTHYGSLGEADLMLEQEMASMDDFENQLRMVTSDPKFRNWSAGFSKLLQRSPKREIFEVVPTA